MKTVLTLLAMIGLPAIIVSIMLVIAIGIGTIDDYLSNSIIYGKFKTIIKVIGYVICGLLIGIMSIDMLYQIFQSLYHMMWS